MFIEIPILLAQNDPNDDTDYHELGLKEPDYPISPETCLINVKDIQRVNRSNMDDYKTVLWTFDGGSYHTTLDYDTVKEMIFKAIKH